MATPHFRNLDRHQKVFCQNKEFICLTKDTFILGIFFNYSEFYACQSVKAMAIEIFVALTQLWCNIIFIKHPPPNTLVSETFNQIFYWCSFLKYNYRDVLFLYFWCLSNLKLNHGKSIG